MYVYRISCKPYSACWQNGTLNCAILACAHSLTHLHSIYWMSSTFFLLLSLISIVMFHSMYIRFQIDAFMCVTEPNNWRDVMYGLVSKFIFHETWLWTCTLVISARRNAQISCGAHIHEWTWILVSFYVQKTHHLHDLHKNLYFLCGLSYWSECISNLYWFFMTIVWNFQGFLPKRDQKML